MSDSPLTQLVYASAATVPFSEDDLDALLSQARRCNSQLDVSGVLLYREASFFQVLEGEASTVKSLYNKIGRDKRHDNVLLLANRQIEQRDFGEWSMGYVRNPADVSELPGFVDFFAGQGFTQLATDSRRMQQILDGFRRGRWRRAAEANIASTAG